jgi:glycosyltransferase EpsE
MIKSIFLGEKMVEVSIIMAVYNTPHRHIVEFAIDSILNQSVENLELIIFDDGSTDNTYELLKDISRKDRRIRLIRHGKNMGSAFARNRCLALARANFVAIMDADDYSHNCRLEEQINFLRSNPEYAFVGARGVYFNDSLEGNLGKYWYCKYPKKEDFLFTLPFVHGSLMFRKQSLLTVHGYKEDQWVRRSEDYDLLMRMYAKGYNGANLPKTLYFIRMDEDTFKRRKYIYRFNESMVKYKGFKELGLMPKGLVYAAKPLIVGLIPKSILNALKTIYYR